MSAIDKKILNQAIDKYIEYAEIQRDSAGFSGAMHDGGYQNMMDELGAYQTGLRGGIPEFLQEYYTEISNEQDPEYAKYLELKDKFEG